MEPDTPRHPQRLALKRLGERILPWRWSYVVALLIFFFGIVLEKNNPGDPPGVFVACVGAIAFIVLIIRDKRVRKGEGEPIDS